MKKNVINNFVVSCGGIEKKYREIAFRELVLKSILKSPTTSRQKT